MVSGDFFNNCAIYWRDWGYGSWVRAETRRRREREGEKERDWSRLSFFGGSLDSQERGYCLACNLRLTLVQRLFCELVESGRMFAIAVLQRLALVRGRDRWFLEAECEGAPID
jgi:hypothetical protein